MFAISSGASPNTFMCRVVGECRSVVSQLEWSQDGTRLLALDQNSIIHIWRMKVRLYRKLSLLHVRIYIVHIYIYTLYCSTVTSRLTLQINHILCDVSPTATEH